MCMYSVHNQSYGAPLYGLHCNNYSLGWLYNRCSVHACELILFAFIPLEQRKALLLENEKLKSSLENKTSTNITITSILLYYVFNLRDTTE